MRWENNYWMERTINDPYLNDTFKINDGLKIARRLLVDITRMDIPVACEFLHSHILI